MTDVSAVVLSKRPYRREFEGLEIVQKLSLIRNSEELLKRRFEAIEKVKTPWFFYLDDDDDLPEDYLDVIGECKAIGADLAYTDELFRYEDGSTQERKSKPYSQEEHYKNPLLVHHLVLCRTEKALEAIARLPFGRYCPEFLLYWEMAKGTTVHIPRIGYIWNKRESGMHRWMDTSMSQMKALLWARDQRSRHA